MIVLNNISGLLTNQVNNLPKTTPEVFLINALGIFYFVTGAVAVIMIIISGFYFIVGGSNSSTITKAKNTILYSVVGLVVIIVAFAITNFITGNFK